MPEKSGLCLAKAEILSCSAQNDNRLEISSEVSQRHHPLFTPVTVLVPELGLGARQFFAPGFVCELMNALHPVEGALPPSAPSSSLCSRLR